jgi:hypothetical protein
VPSLPVTPSPAVAGPFTGGQIEAHDPLQFDLVEVSGTNQYKVWPAASVTTATPPIFVVLRVAAVEAALDEAAEVDGAADVDGAAAEVDGAAEVLEVAGFAGAELPQPAASSAAAGRPAAAHRQPRACPGGR